MKSIFHLPKKHNMEFIDLLKYIAIETSNRGIGFGITRLIELAYLSEIYNYRKNNKRLTNIIWYYYKFGPYPLDQQESIKSLPFEEEDFNNVSFNKIDIESLGKKPELDQSSKFIVDKVISKYSKMNLEELLDYIYYDTEPMMFTNERGEILDFSKVRPEDEFVIKEVTLSKKQKEEIQKKASERFKLARQI
mgnify:CR=1 FL=1